MAEVVTVTRVGTQVVVRFSGVIDDSRTVQLARAMAEIDAVVLGSVVVDCAEAVSISGAGIAFLQEAHRRWRLRLMDPPEGLRRTLLP